MDKHYIVAGKTYSDVIIGLNSKAFDTQEQATKYAKKLASNKDFDMYEVGIYQLLAVADKTYDDVQITEVK